MFGGKNNPGAFVRTRVSSTERSLSWVILALIATLGVAVFFKGQRFDPGLFALDPTLLPATNNRNLPEFQARFLWLRRPKPPACSTAFRPKAGG